MIIQCYGLMCNKHIVFYVVLQSESEKSLYSGENMQQQHWKVCGGLDNLMPFNIFVQRLV